jgi:hypothetical protein
MDIRSDLNVSYSDPGENPYGPQEWYTVTYELALGLEHRIHEVPDASFELFENYPDPFQEATQIGYTLSKPCRVSLKVYNPLGQELKELVSKSQAAGTYSVSWEASGFPSGVYYYSLEGEHAVQVKNMLLIK